MADSSTDLILAAIAALSDRIGSLEKSVDRIDRKLNAVARKLLAPAELVGLGIQDARGPAGGGGGGGGDGAMTSRDWLILIASV
jgi:hypothetical protein